MSSDGSSRNTHRKNRDLYATEVTLAQCGNAVNAKMYSQLHIGQESLQEQTLIIVQNADRDLIGVMIKCNQY